MLNPLQIRKTTKRTERPRLCTLGPRIDSLRDVTSRFAEHRRTLPVDETFNRHLARDHQVGPPRVHQLDWWRAGGGL